VLVPLLRFFFRILYVFVFLCFLVSRKKEEGKVYMSVVFKGKQRKMNEYEMAIGKQC